MFQRTYANCQLPNAPLSHDNACLMTGHGNMHGQETPKSGEHCNAEAELFVICNATAMKHNHWGPGVLSHHVKKWQVHLITRTKGNCEQMLVTK